MSVELLLPSRVLFGLYSKRPEIPACQASLGLAVLVLAILFSSLIYRCTIYRFCVSPFRDLPFPKVCLRCVCTVEAIQMLIQHNQSDRGFLGHLVQFLQEPWGFPLVRWQQIVTTSRSGFYRIFMGPSDYLVPMNSRALSAIMNDPGTFPKTAAVREGFIATLGHGVVSTEGVVHRVSTHCRISKISCM